MSDTKHRISGFCNPTNDAASHARCKGFVGDKPCTCPHHDEAPISRPSIHFMPDLVQGTDEWYEQRRGMVTASVVDRLLTATKQIADNETSRGLTMLLTAERITGFVDPTWQTQDMLRGQLDEPVARDLYREHYGDVTEYGLIVRDDFGFDIGCSPDGLVGDDGGIEIKSRRQKKQMQTVLSDDVPAENMAQIQTCLLVTDRKWWDYISFCGGMHLWRKRIYPDPDWQTAIVEAVSAFEKNSADITDRYLKAVAGLPTTERSTDLEMVI